MGTLY